MEQDNEIKGTGNSLDFGARIYDSRVSRWLSTDPAERRFAAMSPYLAFNGNPILFVDPDGETGITYINVFHKDGSVSSYQVVTDDYIVRRVVVNDSWVSDYHYEYDYYDYAQSINIREVGRNGERAIIEQHNWENKKSHRVPFRWVGNLVGWQKSRQQATFQPSGLHLTTEGSPGSNETYAQSAGVDQVNIDLLLGVLGAVGKMAGTGGYQPNGSLLTFAKNGATGKPTGEDLNELAKTLEMAVGTVTGIVEEVDDMKKNRKVRQDIYTDDSVMRQEIETRTQNGIEVYAFPHKNGDTTYMTTEETVGTRPGPNN